MSFQSHFPLLWPKLHRNQLLDWVSICLLKNFRWTARGRTLSSSPFSVRTSLILLDAPLSNCQYSIQGRQVQCRNDQMQGSYNVNTNMMELYSSCSSVLANCRSDGLLWIVVSVSDWSHGPILASDWSVPSPQMMLECCHVTRLLATAAAQKSQPLVTSLRRRSDVTRG